MPKYKFYKNVKSPTGNPSDLCIVLDDETIYSPIGQHGSYVKAYLDDCIEITKEQYVEESKGLLTPEEYLK